MPSATRNTNANSGIELSAPANPNTYLKNTAERPSEPKYDRMTVPISSTGATTARSSRARMISTTTSTSGMITLRSRMA